MKLSDLEAKNSQLETPQSAVVYGSPGVGKTTLVGQLAKKYKVIWVDVEGGYQALLSNVPKEYWDNIELIIVRDSSDTPNAVKTLGRLVTENKVHKICPEHGVVSCIDCTKTPGTEWIELNLYATDTSTVFVLDSLTQLSDSAMAHALGKVDTFDKKKVEYDHYDRQGLLLKNILTAMKRLPCHVIFISHEEEIALNDGSVKLSPCAGTRNFSRKVARYFDHKIYVQIKNKQHRALSSSTAEMKVQTGSRNRVELEAGEDITNLFSAKPITGNEVSFNFAAGTPGASQAAGSKNAAAAALLSKVKK